jgi:hypothetical protein
MSAVAEDREHVLPDRVRIEGIGEFRTGRRHPTVDPGHLTDHRVHHLRRHQHRHRGALGLVALEVLIEPVLDQVTHELAQLFDVLDAVHALPLRVLPLLGGDVAPPREAGPVRLDEGVPPVDIGLDDVGAHAGRIRKR